MLRRAWLNDLIFLLANSQIIGLSLAAIISGIVIVSGRLLGPSIHTIVASQPYWLQFIEALILSDIGFYFAHRMFHAVPWLWKFHTIHHGIKELDWLAGARVHPIDQIITKGVSLLPVFALGFSDVVIGAYMSLYAWQSVFIHSNVNIKFGPLRWILASPEFHHWHHSIDVEARDRILPASCRFSMFCSARCICRLVDGPPPTESIRRWSITICSSLRTRSGLRPTPTARPTRPTPHRRRLSARTCQPTRCRLNLHFPDDRG